MRLRFLVTILAILGLDAAAARPDFVRALLAQDAGDMTRDGAPPFDLEAFVERIERAYVDPAAVRYEFTWTRSAPEEEDFRLAGSATLVSPSEGRPFGIRIAGVRGIAQPDSFLLQQVDDRVELVDFGDRVHWQTTVMRSGISLLREKAGPLHAAFRDPGRLEEAIEYGLRLRGTSEIDGTLCRRLQLVFPSGTVETWYVDERTAWIRRHEKRSAASRGGATEVLEMRGVRAVADSEIDREPFPRRASLPVRSYVPAGPRIGEPAPDWSVTARSGRTLELASLRGQVVVLDFWATWCVPCRRSIPELQALHEERSGDGVFVVGATWKETGDPEAFLAEHDVTYEIVDGSSLGAAYGMDVYGLPTVFVIDRRGRVADLSSGYRPGWSETWLREAVEAALNGE